MILLDVGITWITTSRKVSFFLVRKQNKKATFEPFPIPPSTKIKDKMLNTFSWKEKML